MMDTSWQMHPNTKAALYLAKRDLSTLVCDAVALEGINFTLPEIQTLLDGITIGGRKVSDQQIVLNQAKAWKMIFADIKSGDFELSKEYALKLHNVAAYEEALEWGIFRFTLVSISGTDYTPPDASDLDLCYSSMVEEIGKFDDIYDQSMMIFLHMARNQFFFDVNKRMGRFMMNGNLLMKG